MKILIFILSIAWFSGCERKKPLNTNLEGKAIPSFNILLTDSTTFNTKYVNNNGPVVLFYFGPYCAYSKAQMAEIITNDSELKNIHFIIFTSYPIKDVVKFSSHYKLSNYPNITIGVDYQNYFSRYFDAKGVPYTAIYGRDKRLKKVFLGQISGDQIKEVTEE